MARKTNEERLADIHAEALREYDAIIDAVGDERLQCLEDRRFCMPGGQWEGSIGEQFENKPQFESNKVLAGVMRIENEYRNNRITVDFVSKDGAEDDKLADVCDGLYRADEQDSVADEARDNAFQEGIIGGFGAWRLRAAYEDEEDPENERQRIRIEPIFDADSRVFFDLDAKRQDKSDAKRCFVLNSQSPDSYKEEWGDDPNSWPKEIQATEFDWATPDVVYVAEYYRVEMKKDELVTFQDISGETETYYKSELDDEEGLLDNLLTTGNKEIKRRKITTRNVHKYIMSGGRILEDCGIIAGKHIPIIPFFGRRWFIDGVERCMGHVRPAKDPQRVKNMQFSKLAEISALSSVSKPIVTKDQMIGNEKWWSDDNIENYPYLTLNEVFDANGNRIIAPLEYTRPPEIPQALAALLQLTEQDMAEILGNNQQGDKMVSNISGKAIEMIQTRLDMQAFIYMSNMAKAVQREGVIWLSMTKDILTGEANKNRKMKTIGPMGEIGHIDLNRPILDPETGELVYENDLSEAEMDVVSTVGPSSVSRREATVRSLINMMGLVQDPETAQVLQSMIMMNMDGEGVEEYRDFWRKRLVKAGVVKPNDEEKEEMAAALANTPPDPNAVYLEAAAKELDAKAKKAGADSIKALSDAALTRAKTVDTLSTMDIKEQTHALDIAQKMDEVLNEGNQPPESSAVDEGME